MVGQINIVAVSSSSSTGGASSSSSTGGDSSSPSSTGASNNSSSTAGASSSPSSTGASSTDSSTGASSPSSPSSSSSSSVGPAAPITGATLTGAFFRITGIQKNGTLNTAYIFTSNGVEYANPSLNVYAGVVVTFSLEWLPVTSHPFGFSPNGNSSTISQTVADFPDVYNAENGLNCSTPVNGVKVYAPQTVGTPCVLTEVLDAQFIGQSSYYRCAYHSLMMGKITVVAAPSSSSSSTGGATSAPTGTGTSSTPAPTTTAPTTPPGSKSSSSSTGTTGAASQVAGTGLAFIAAIMAAIMA